MERKSLRELVAKEQIFAPIVWDVLSAKCAEAAGFKATLLSGGVVAQAFLPAFGALIPRLG